MSRIKSRLTVFFEEPFWVGVFEQETDGVIRAARVVFGAQPTDAEVFEFVLRHADRLRYGPPVEGRLSRETANPKKRRREAARETGLCSLKYHKHKSHAISNRSERHR